MAEPLDVGLVVGGPGAGAQLAALRRVAEARPLGVAGRDGAAVRRLAARSGTEAFPSVAKLLEVEALDLVVVAGPWPENGRLARAALRAGKHVWLEPPGARSAAELARLHAEAKQAGVRLAVALSARHHPSVGALRRGVAGGRVGSVAMVRYELRRPWWGLDHAVEAEAAQALDLVGYVTGKAPASAFALGQHELMTYLVIHLTLQGNAIGTVGVHLAPDEPTRFPPREQLVVVGTQGTLRAGRRFDGKLILGADDPLAGRVAALRAMVRHIRGGGPPPAPPAQARRVLETLAAAGASAHRGQPVTLQSVRRR